VDFGESWGRKNRLSLPVWDTRERALPRRQGALSLSYPIPLQLHCTALHCSPLMRPLSSPPLRRFRKHATPRPMCTWTGPSARRWNGSGPIHHPRSAFATVRACMYCARVDSVPHFRSTPPRAVTMARMVCVGDDDGSGAGPGFRRFHRDWPSAPA
jgi:hypothetical protein